VYRINGQYSKIAGTLFQLYDYRSFGETTKLEIYGDGKLLYQASMAGGIDPLDFSINLTGVLELKVINRGDRSYYAAISDCGLYT